MYPRAGRSRFVWRFRSSIDHESRRGRINQCSRKSDCDGYPLHSFSGRGYFICILGYRLPLGVLRCCRSQYVAKLYVNAFCGVSACPRNMFPCESVFIEKRDRNLYCYGRDTSPLAGILAPGAIKSNFCALSNKNNRPPSALPHPLYRTYSLL